MANGSSYVHKITVESKTLPVGPKSDVAGAKGDATVSPCGGISISMSRDRPNEAIIITAEDVRDSQANFEYKIEGGTYDKTNVYDSLPEGDQTFYVRETNKSCVFEVTKEVIHCDLTLSTTITDEKYDLQDGKIEVTANTSSSLYEWKFDGGEWFIGEETESWAGLNQGTYTVQARDEWGCMVSKDLTVSNVQDTEAPSIPSGLTITDRADGEATVLDWDPSTDDERSVSHYRIFRSTTSGFTADSTTLVKDNLTTTTWEDEAVTNGTTYYYRISVVDTSDQANESTASPEKEYIFTDDVAPQPPSGLSGSVSDNTIGLSWTASASPDVEEYVVYVDDGTGPVIDGRTSSTSYSITGLVNEQEHTVRVTAEDEANNQSPFTDAVTKTPIDTTPPAVPTGLSATFSDPNNEVNLSWGANTEDDFEHYDLYRSTSSGGPYTKVNGSEITAESYADESVDIPQTYYYVIEAVDDDDLTSGYSTEVSISTGTVPAAPTGVVATYDDANDEVNLSWDDNTESDLSHYNVYRSGTSGGPYSEVSSSNITTSSYTDGSTSIAETYYYVIEAVDQDGIASPYSTEVTVLTGTAPSAPTGLSGSFNSSNTEVNLNWDDNLESDLSEYIVYRSQTSGSNYSEVETSTNSQYTDGTISTGKTYYYVVTAVDNDDLESGYSNEAQVNTTTSELYSYDEPADLQNNKWTNRVYESDSIKVNNGDLEAPSYDEINGFEDNTQQGWVFDNSSMSVKTDRARGTYSIGMNLGDPGQTDQAHKTFIPNGAKVNYVEYYYNEDSGSNGAAVQVRDSSGYPVIATATNNPQWDIEDSSGWYEYYNGDGVYDDWHRVKIIFDWVNGTADVEWENLNSGVAKTFTGIDLINSTDLSSLYIRGYNNQAYSNNNDFVTWLDDFEVNGGIVNKAYRIAEPISLGNINDVNDSLINFTDGSPSGASVEVSTLVNDSSESPRGYSVNFDGSGDHVLVGSTSYHISGSDSLTISAWVKWDGSTDTIQGIFESMDSTDTFDVSNPPYGLFLRPNGEPRFLIQGASDISNEFTVFESAPVDEWQHIVVVKNGTDIKMYVDGVEKLNSSFSGDIYDYSEDIQIGVWKNADDRFFSGNLSRVKLYSKGLTASQVSDLYNGKNVTDGILGDWRMDDGSNGVTDYAGGNDGTLQDNASWELDSPSPFSFSTQIDGEPINDISQGDDLKGKYLWIRQDLFSDGNSVPSLDSFHAEVDTNPTLYVPSPPIEKKYSTSTSTTLEIGGIWYSADEYRIYRSSSQGGPYSLVKTISNPNAVETYQETGLGQTYYYVATIVQNSTESSNSEEIKFESAIKEDFENQSLSGWDIFDTGFEIKSAYAYNSSYSAGISQSSTSTNHISSKPFEAGKYSKFEVYYLETSSSTGGGFRLFNSNGNPECGFATNNPQWHITDYASSDFSELYNPGMYKIWIRVEFTFSWQTGNFSYVIEEFSTGHQETGTLGLKNEVDISEFRVYNFNRPGGSPTWNHTGSMHLFIDDLLVKP